MILDDYEKVAQFKNDPKYKDLDLEYILLALISERSLDDIKSELGSNDWENMLETLEYTEKKLNDRA